MSISELSERFFHINMQAYEAKQKLLAKKQTKFLAEQNAARLSQMITVIEEELLSLERENNALAFELLLHTPCYQFAKLLDLLDL